MHSELVIDVDIRMDMSAYYDASCNFCQAVAQAATANAGIARHTELESCICLSLRQFWLLKLSDLIADGCFNEAFV